MARTATSARSVATQQSVLIGELMPAKAVRLIGAPLTPLRNLVSHVLGLRSFP
jgi:hypothetical protein